MMMSFLPMLAGMAGLAVYLVWFYSGRRNRGETSEAPQATVRCPSCAADNFMAMGQVLERCEHCEAPLMPTETLMGEGERAASLDLRRARMTQYRAERRAWSKMRARASSKLRAFFGTVAILLIPLAAASIWTVAILRGVEPFHPGIILLWTLFFVAINGAFGLHLWRKARLERFERAAKGLATRGGGQWAGGVELAVSWLDAYWAAPYEPHNLLAGRYATTMTLGPQGYPCLVLCDPVAPDEHREAKIHIFLAAFVPGLSDGTGRVFADSQAAAGARQWLSDLAVTVELTEAGVMCRVQPHLVAALRKSPDRLVELEGVLLAAAQYAQARGALPASPLR